MGNSKWSLLHDIGYVYFVLGIMAQSEEKTIQVRLSKMKEKFSEWPAEGNNNEKILKEVMQTAGKDMEDSMDPVLKRLQSSISNIVENLSKDNLKAIINDLLSIVNAASPSDAEIDQINSMAEQIGLKPLTKQKAKGKSEQSSTDDESWTLLHDMCYLYYIVAFLPIFLGSKDAKNVKLRVDAGKEKILEWPSDDVDGEQLVKKVSRIVTKAWSSDGIKVGDKIKELAAKIKEYMPEENHQLVIEDLQYIVNKWSPNKDDDKTMIERIAHIILDDGGSADKETVTSSTAGKGTFDNEHIYGMAYVYFDVVLRHQEQSKDELQAKVHVINEKLSEWARNSDGITEIMQDCWKTYIHDCNEDHETYEGKLEKFIFKMKDNMSEEQLSMVIADLNDIVSRNGKPHNKETYMIQGLTEMFGLSLDSKQHSSVQETLTMAINDAKGCLTQDTDPPYPGKFCIPGTLYEGRFTYVPFPQVVGKSKKYKADDLFRRFTSDEVSKIVSKIEAEKKIPYLVFVKEILDTKMTIPDKAPYWFMPFVIVGRNKGMMLYFNQDGFWNNRENPKVLKQCSPAEMIDSTEIKDGHFTDFVMEPFKKNMPSLTVDAGIISTMRVSCSDEGRVIELDIAEMHGKEYGPQLEIMEAIWNIWKEVVEQSRGASSYMYDPAIFKAFHSWQEVIDWAYEGEKKAAGEQTDNANQAKESLNSEFLSLHTEPSYPGQFYFLTEKYSSRPINIKNFLRLSRIDELFRKFSKKEVDCLVKKIKTTRTIPKLSFIRDILEEKYDIPVKDAPFWFIPFAILAEKIGCFLYFDRNGIYANHDKTREINPCFSWEGATDVTYTNGFPELDDEDDGGLEISISPDPDAEYSNPEETVSTLVLETEDGHLTINEFHGDESGSQLLIIKTIWDLWKIVVDYSRGSSIWPQDDKVPNGPEYMYFDSWDGLLAWAEAGSAEDKTKKSSSKVVDAIKTDKMDGDDANNVTDKNEDLYRQKVKDALADGVVTDLERTGLDFFQHKLKLPDEEALRIFEKALAEMQEKSKEPEKVGRDGKPTKIISAKTIISSDSDKEADGEVESARKRITYESWDEFSREQSIKDERKKTNLPIAKKIHDLLVNALEANNKKFEIRYGDGTFSFSMPKDKARSGKRTFARVGLLNVVGNTIYLDTLYKGADEVIPTGGSPWSKKDQTKYEFVMKTLDDFEKVKDSIKQGVIRSYQYLAI